MKIRKGIFVIPVVFSIGMTVLLLGVLQGIRPQVGVAKALRDTDVTDDITANTTWVVVSSPYILQNSIAVTPGVTLTVEAGVVVSGAYGSELRVRGRLVALGTATQPVTFTDSDNSSRWAGLVFDSGTGELHHTTVSWGEDYGLYITGSHVVVSGATFINSGGNNDYSLRAIGTSTVLTVTGSRFYNDNDRVYAVGVAVDHLHQVQTWGNTFYDSGRNRQVLIAGGVLTGNAVLTHQAGLEGYVLRNDVTVSRGVTLTVGAGAAVMGWDQARLEVLGHLQALGTDAEPITFTSEPNSGAGQWDGLLFDGGTGELHEVTVRYGGQGGTYSNIAVRDVLTGQVRIESGRVLTGSRYGSIGVDYGVYVENSHVVVSSTLFRGNGSQGQSNDYALYASGANTVLTVTGSDFENNWGYAVRVEADDVGAVTDNSFAGSDTRHIRRVLVAGGSVAAGAILTRQTGLEGYVLRDDVTVPGGVTLTVGAGATVMGWDQAALEVWGHLQAVGTATEPITFTSEPNSGAGQWDGLVFDGGTGELYEVTVRYGGQGGAHSNVAVRDVLTGQVRIESSRVFTEDGAFSIVDYGLYITDSHVVVSDTLFRGNGTPNYSNDYAFYAAGANTVLTVTGSDFENNWGYAARVEADDVGAVTDNSFAGTDTRHIRRVLVAGGSVAAGTVLTPQTGLEGYELDGNLVVLEGDTLTVAPSAMVMGQDDVELQVRGQLLAMGSAARPITFTSSNDTAPAQWAGLAFDGGRGELHEVTVRYGGDVNSVGVRSNIAVRDVLTGQVRLASSRVISVEDGVAGLPDYGMYITNSHVLINGTTFWNNGAGDDGDCALYTAGASAVLTVSESAVRDNWGSGVSVNDGWAIVSCSEIVNNGRDGIQVTGSPISVTVSGSAIDGNTDYGLRNTSLITVDARYNSWGGGAPTGSDIWGPVLSDPYLETPLCAVDLSVAKSDVPDHVYVAEPLTYTIVLTNNSVAPARGLVLTDSLPLSVTYHSHSASRGSCSAGSGDVTCTLDLLEPGTNAMVTIVVTPTDHGIISNVVEVTPTTQLDPQAAWRHSNTATEDTTVRASTDLQVTQSDAPDPVALNHLLVYTIMVVNHGPSAARAVTLTDALPGNPSTVLYGGATPSQGGCSEAGHTLTCNLGALAQDDVATVTVLVTPTVPGTITNTLSVTGTETDRRLYNNISQEFTTVGWADLTLRKSGASNSLLVGDRLTFTLVVTNNGPLLDANVTLVDRLPESMTYVSASPVCTGTEVITCELGALAPADSTTVTIVVTPTQAGTITNTASVTGTTWDPDTRDNTDTFTVQVTPVANLVLSQARAPGLVLEGYPLTYTIVVTNTGPSTALGVTLADVLTGDFAFSSATFGPQSCTLAGNSVTCHRDELLADDFELATIVVTPTAPGTLTSTASVTSTAFDRNVLDNTDTITLEVQPVADLAISKSGTPALLGGVGEVLTYTVTVINDGPSTATQVVLTDELPAGVNLISYSPSCSGTTPVITCTLGDLNSGASETVTVVVTPTVIGTITNTVEVVGAEFDSNRASNAAHARVTVGTSDLGVAKSASHGRVMVGDFLTYTVVITNDGPDAATSVWLTDTLPPSVTLAVVMPSQGVCNGMNPITCPLDTLAPHASATVTIVVRTIVDGLITNVASVADDQVDPGGNNEAFADTIVDPTADLWVTKSAVPGPISMGTTLTYTVIVTNNGPSAATGVVVTDDLPAEVNLISYSSGCSGSDPVICALNTLRAGVTATIVITVEPTAGGTITNQVSVRGQEFDAVDNNVAMVSTVVRGGAVYLPVVLKSP